MDENKIMNLMSNIEYGWVDKNHNKHVEDFDDFSSDYVLQSPEQLLESKLGVCWDQVELERHYFSNTDYETKTYFIVHYDGEKCPTHTFLVFKNDNKYYWFEHSWYKYKGIYVYTTLNGLLKDVRQKFIADLDDNYDDDKVVIHEYTRPEYNINVQEFYKHCDDGPFISVK